MPYKTILVHINNERRASVLIEHAAHLAETFSSHVIGLYVFPAYRLIPPVPMPFAKELAGTLHNELHEEQKRIRKIFEASVSGRPFVGEWRLITQENNPVAETVLAQTKAADLIIASQADPNWGFSSIIDCPERLAIEGGRPLLVIPNAGRFAPVPKVAVIGWNGRREGVRAAFDALPLLKLAQRVEIVTVKEGVQEDRGRLPDTEIATALARHGIKANVTVHAARSASAAHELRRIAAELHADLLVMGAYGHTRIAEFVLGGATRDMLKEMTIPVLFSH